MEKLKYDTDDFSFKELLWDWFKVDLDRLHENSKYKYFNRKTDQQTYWHKIFYKKVRSSDEWNWMYKWFIKEIKKVRWENKPIVYQKIPTFRVHFPDNVAVGEWHKDIEYRSKDWVNELNYYVPLTEAKNTSTIQLEDNKTLDSDYGEYWDDELDPFANGGEELKGDTFHIQAYSWAMCECAVFEDDYEKCDCGYKEQKYNFRWDGTNEIEPIEVSWYKYFPRGNSVNRETTVEETQLMLREIISYLIEKN